MKTKRVCCALLISLLLFMLTGCGMIDNLQNAEYHGGPFENNLESARTYLLAQLQEKYGIEFSVVGKEKLHNYGPFHGATYSCEVAPTDTPERVATALVSQTDYQEVRDDYAVYYFKEDAGNRKNVDSRGWAGTVPLGKRSICKIGFALYGRFRYRNVCGIPL